MFSGIAGSEIFLIIAIGLIVLGPKRLPQVANQLGSWVGQARRMTRMMKRQLEEEINIDLNSINKPIDLEKGLMGLADNDQADEKKTPNRDADVSRPEYVHERSDEEPEAATDEADEVPELPDDYSPVHGPEDSGTGVGDDDEYISDDELEPVVAAAPDAGSENDAEDAGDAQDEPKKETA